MFLFYPDPKISSSTPIESLFRLHHLLELYHSATVIFYLMESSEGSIFYSNRIIHSFSSITHQRNFIFYSNRIIHSFSLPPLPHPGDFINSQTWIICWPAPPLASHHLVRSTDPMPASLAFNTTRKMDHHLRICSHPGPVMHPDASGQIEPCHLVSCVC